MGLPEMLGTLKGKVLDAANIELLEHTYNLQERTIKQLESNNNALEKRNELLEKDLKRLEEENKGLTMVIKDCEEQLEGLEKKEGSKQKYSNNASAVLSYFLKNDITNGYEKAIIAHLEKEGFSKIKIQGGISELAESKIILHWSTHHSYGIEWGLTDEGKRLLARCND